MKRITLAIVALAAGAGAMYYLDPGQGRRRRAEVGQRLDHWRHAAQRQARGRAEDLGNRLRGLWAESRGLLQRWRERRQAELPDAGAGLEPLSMIPEPLEHHARGGSKLLPVLAVAAPVAVAVGAAVGAVVLRQRHAALSGEWLH